jgi:HAD superfamily hydrolase (TIGR01549 family)
MHIKGILFDFDGTLADTLPICIQTFQDVLQEFTGRPYTVNEVVAHFGICDEGILQRELGDRWPAAMDRYMEIYAVLHAQCQQPFAQVEPLLRRLKATGIPLGLITGKGPRTAAFSLNYLNLTQYFRNIEVGDMHAIVKAQAMRKILAEWGMDPSTAAYVGDAETDMSEARSAGVIPVAACWTATASIDHRSQELAFTSIDSFIAWLHEHTLIGQA